MRDRLLWFIIYLISSGVFAQNLTIDSLQVALRNEDSQQKKSDILHELASQSWDYDFEKGLDYADQAYKIAKASSYIQGQAQALSDKGLYYYFIGDYKKALTNYLASIQITKSKIYDIYPAYTLLRIGSMYRVQAQFDSANVYYQMVEKTLERQDDDFLRATLYQYLGIINNDLSNFTIAIQYFNKSINVTSSLGHSSFLAERWNGLGQSYKELWQFDSAIFYYEKAYSSTQLSKNLELEMYYFLNRGEIHFLQGEYTLAIKLYTKALEILKDHNFQRYYIVALKNIGQVLDTRSEYAQALGYYQRAMRIAEKLNSQQEVAHINASIGWLYAAQNIDSLAIYHANLSLLKMMEIGDDGGIAYAYNLLGYIFYTQKEFDKSISYFIRALEIREKINSKILISSTLYNMARVFEDQGLLQKALEYHLKAIELRIKYENREGLVFSYNSLGTLYTKLGDYKKAETYLLNAQELSKILSQPLRKLENYKYLGGLYKKMGNFKKALYNSEQYADLKDSIFNMQTASKIAEMNALYELQNKEHDIEILNQQNTVKQSLIRLQESKIVQQKLFLIITIACISLLMILAYVLYRFYKNKKKANVELLKLNREIHEKSEEIETQSEELQEANSWLRQLNRNVVEKSEEIQAQSEELAEANETISSINSSLEQKITERTVDLNQAYTELDTFFYRSSHDFRRPLTTLMGLAEVAKITLSDRSALDLFSKVNETAIGLDGMLHKLQAFSLISSSDLVYGVIDFDRNIDLVSESFHTIIIEKRIRIIRHINLARTFSSFAPVVRLIFQNLIENSIHFTRTDPEINIRVSENTGVLIIEIADNGEGILAEFQNRIFEMYFRANEKSKGNGLGLYIVKKAVEKLGGTISFVSRLDEGSTFTVTLPFEHKV